MNAARTLILFVILGLMPCQALTQQRAGAIVERISGAVLLKQNGKQIRLNAKADVARVLYVGDGVYCEKGARLSLRIGSKTTELDERSGWFTIPPRVSSQSDPHQKAIDEYGRIGGRDKGFISNSTVYSPSDKSVVMPELFVIRWTPLKRRCVASFVIQKPDGQELWRQDKVNGASGSLISAAARQALMNYRAKVGAATLLLKLKDSCGNDDQETFRLLSAASEESLKGELAFWDHEPDKLIAHLGRASVFGRYSIFPQAAEEYEAALAAAPKSHDLLLRTISAHRRTGNRARANQLEKRLRLSTDVQ